MTLDGYRTEGRSLAMSGDESGGGVTECEGPWTLLLEKQDQAGS